MTKKNKLQLATIILLAFSISFTSCKPKKTLTVTPSSQSIEKDAGSFTIAVASNTSWTASSNEDWCKLSVKSGSNDATITVDYEATTEAIERTANITFSGEDANNVVINVTQEGGIEKQYLKKRVYYRADTISYSYTIKFNDKNLIEEFNYEIPNIKIIYEYDEYDKIIKRTSYRSDTLNYYVNYEYDTDGKVIKGITHFYSNYSKTLNYYDIEELIDYTYITKSIKGWTSSYNTYEYNNLGQMMKKNIYSSAGDQIYYNIFEYDNIGNIIKEDQYRVSDIDYKRKEYNYSYDDKNSVYLNLNGVKIFRSSIQKNNLLSRNIVTYNQEGEVINTQNDTYSYEYNDKDFPISITENNGNHATYEYISIVK